MVLPRLLAPALLALLCTAGTVLADEDCKPSGCSCSTSNLTLDLTQIFSELPAKTVADQKYDITYMPCSPQVCPHDTTDNPSVVCQVEISDTSVAFSLGRASGVKWTVTQFDPLKFQIKYINGDGDRQTILLFRHGTGATVFSYDRENPQKTYDFNVVGSSVAPARRGGGGGSSGSGDVSGPIGLTLIFLAIAVLVAYFVVGGIFMYTQRGARGMEVIPNAVFWKDLPFLIKDGFFFTISPCYKREKYQGL